MESSGGNLAVRAGLASSFSVAEAQRLMAAVPADVANDVWRARCTTVHSHFPRHDHVGKHPVVHRTAEEQARLLRSMARCVQDTRFAEMCRDLATDVVTAEDRLVELGRADEATGIRALMIGQPMEWVVQVWRIADLMDELRARQRAWGMSHHRIARVLKSARIPMWVVGALDGIAHDDLRAMTAGELVSRAGLGEVWLEEAARVLDRLRALALLGVEPADWNEFLEKLAARLEVAEASQSSLVEEVAVPPQPCHPPGALLIAEPRVPRAPGHVVPRRPIHRDRGQLHHHGGLGGRLTV
ncbi:hypothetical protein [Streptomyces sp. NRRL F-5053]|uniref:hypothetical protein n=1 Tax=Streptomyces sp. NRRL F-5053 TaxID=1463854 RepID=UPI001331B36C|nr:hypothetical protein [Streptomyces sp. NRRL F-5053]